MHAYSCIPHKGNDFTGSDLSSSFWWIDNSISPTDLLLGSSSSPGNITSAAVFNFSFHEEDPILLLLFSGLKNPGFNFTAEQRLCFAFDFKRRFGGRRFLSVHGHDFCSQASWISSLESASQDPLLMLHQRRMISLPFFVREG